MKRRTICWCLVLQCVLGLLAMARGVGLEELRAQAGSGQLTVYANNPVLAPGAPGEWDAGALGSMSVVKVGAVLHMYYEAWGVRGKGAADTQQDYTSLQIGHATSPDGVSWTKDPSNPVLRKGAGNDWDRDGTWDPFVLYEDGLYKMWYGGGAAHCDWGYAVSTDGVHFVKKGQISHLGQVEDDHVVHDKTSGHYFMYYWDRKHEPLGLYCAESVNETEFDFAHAKPIHIEGLKYPKMYKFTHVLQEAGQWQMFFGEFVRPGCKGCHTGYATSSDGLHWKAQNPNLLTGQDGEVVKIADDLWMMYYGRDGYFDQAGGDIRVALFKSLAACQALAAPVHPKPNIVIIIADDLGYGDLGCYGATKIKTPNIDRLAAEGVRFTQGYAPSSTCTPSRFSLMTGEYAWRRKDRKNGILDGDAPLCIEPGRLTLPAMLHQAGYQSGIVGKWHLGLGDGRTPVNFNTEIKPGPIEVGFDYSYIIPATVDRVPDVWIENHRVVGLDPADPIAVSYVSNISDDPTGLERPDLLKQQADRQHSGTIINGISRIGYMRGGKSARFKDEDLATTIVDKSVEFIERHKDEPFFLEAALFEPHVPRVAGSRLVGSSQCGVRGDVIQQIDWETGEIIKALERLKLLDNTLVILSSDNGAILFDGYTDHSFEDLNGHQPTGGLRGWKYLVFEGGCRVPLIAHWPAQIKPRVSDQMFSLVDCLATLAGITGQSVPKAVAPDSLDLSAVLLGTTTSNLRDNTVLHGVSDTLALRLGDWKFIPANASGKSTATGKPADASEARFTPGHTPGAMLFNLASDPGETTNLLQKYPEKAAAMQQRLTAIKNAGTP